MKTAIVNAMVGIFGIDSIVSVALKWFNKSVLAKIEDKAEFTAYVEDVAAIGFLLDGIMNRHTRWLSDGKRRALASTISSVNGLANALCDANLTKAEMNAVIDSVTAAVKDWEDAK